jgi:hypothetical protein
LIQLYITSYNRTTNEDSKWSDITKWYKKEQTKYREAVKKGLVKGNAASSATAETPTFNDGDVSCTGGSAGLQTAASRTGYVDPGPVPKNVYDRGFVENWKEVLFPISKRKEALDMGGYSRKAPDKPKFEQGNKAVASIQSLPDKTD